MPEFEGTSDTSKLQEALEKALQKALSSIPHTDAMISYSVKRIGGRKGGIAGFNELVVVIDAELH